MQKKRRFSSDVSDTEVIEALSKVICTIGEEILSPDGLFKGNKDSCEFMNEDLSDIFRVSVGVDNLYTEALKRLNETSTRELGKKELKADGNIYSGSAAVIKKRELVVVVEYWTEFVSNGGYDADGCIFVVETLKQSSKFIPEIDDLREVYLERLMYQFEHKNVDN